MAEKELNYHELMKNVWADVQDLIPGHIERLSWTRERLRQFQTEALRNLLREARRSTDFCGQALGSADFEVHVSVIFGFLNILGLT